VVRLSTKALNLAADVRGGAAALRLAGAGDFRAAALRARTGTAFAISALPHCIKRSKYKEELPD
jgi:hypothetical protein